LIYRRASLAKLAQIRGDLDITFVEAQRQVSKTDSPIVNSDFNQG